MVTVKTVRKIARTLTGVAEDNSYGTLSFKVRGKFLGRIREDNESLVIWIDPDERKEWHSADPETFTVPDHYKKYKYMVVELLTAEEKDVRILFERAWQSRAPASLRKQDDS